MENKKMMMPVYPNPKDASLFKKIGWFLAGFPRLGVTWRQVKYNRLVDEDHLTALRAIIARLEKIELYLGIGAGNQDVLSAMRADLVRLASAIDGDLDSVEQRVQSAVHAQFRAETEKIAQKTDDIHEFVHGRFGSTLNDRFDAVETAVADLAGTRASDNALTARGLSELGRRLDIVRHGGKVMPPVSDPPSDGMEALLDSFYNRLEARYRGSREEIVRRLTIYLPDAQSAVGRTGKGILDLGCGRGEWLELLKDRGLAAVGVDLNPVQVAEAEERGLDARLADACSYLAETPDNSLAMVTAHHLVEHLPFRTVAWIARECLRVLAPGGILLFETPNPDSLLVGARSFYMDPTHVRPLPAPVLNTLLDTVGFHPIEVRNLHPHEKLDTYFRHNRIDPEIAGLIFGPQDLAILGVKPPLVPE
jgi:O-antigen chain-terminating methyltransferase